MTGVISAAFSRTGAVFVALLVLCGFGYVSYLDIPKEATPDVDIPVAYVSVGYEGISPEDSERLLVKPLEKHLRSVQGLDKMSSVASEGYASVSLEFDAGEDIDRILDDVRQAVDDAKPDLPGEADEPKVTEVNLSLFPILTAALYGPVSEREMVLAAREIKDKVEALIKLREKARSERNWQEADKIRDEISELGVVIEDADSGPTWRIADP